MPKLSPRRMRALALAMTLTAAAAAWCAFTAASWAAGRLQRWERR